MKEREREEARLLIVSKIHTELALIPDEEIVAKFFAYVRGGLSTFVDHPIGEEKPSYLTAINYVLSIASSKTDVKQQEIFRNKWLKFKEHISEFARVDEKILEAKSLSILSELKKEKNSNAEEIISLIRETLPSKCGDIWKETQDYEDVLSDREWSRACSMSEGTGRSPWLFLD
ncbi:MAG: hypothetical protein NTV03_01140 [Candidatus Nomurabacteria bacterium]|nr:hypothetical protein [Candidatus Nomurabacteria bacterium]